MCGICGIFNLDKQPLEPAVLERMTAAIAHRGPDSDGFHIDPPQLGLGFRRLAIIDLTTGDQPIYSEDRQIVTIFNGEIYNFRALRAELEALGHHFTSQADTEVLVHGYESWGIDLVQRLRGMYAFAIWDMGQQKLLLVRDRLGQKPLYYARWGDTFVFASEIKALLHHPSARRNINHSVLAEYLTLGYTLPPHTLFEGIYKLGGGQLLTLSADGNPQIEQYWQPTQKIDHQPSRQDHARRLRQMIEKSVALRMMSDVPLGTFLSGGVDSSTVTALTGQLTGQPVEAFTVGFDFQSGSVGDQKFNSDLHHARQAAQVLGCHHHEIILRHDAVLAKLLPQLVYALDEPLSETAIMQTVFVTALARQHGVPVLLSGDGADETLGGYPFFQQANLVQNYARLPLRAALLDPLIRLLPKKGRFQNFHKLAEKAQLNTPAEHFLTWESHHRTAAPLMADHACAEQGIMNLHQKINALLEPLESPHLADWVGYAKLRLWLQEDNNMRYDKMAMWMSVEPRAPFEDHELVELALSIPLRHKLPEGGKAVLKDAVRDLLPASILKRPKWGFNPPMSDWLRDPLRPLLEHYLSADRLQATGLNPAPIRQMLDDHLARRGYYLNELWNILMLQLWVAIFIEQSLTLETRWSAQDIWEISRGRS